jgi:hypothetical protein
MSDNNLSYLRIAILTRCAIGTSFEASRPTATCDEEPSSEAPFINSKISKHAMLLIHTKVSNTYHSATLIHSILFNGFSNLDSSFRSTSSHFICIDTFLEIVLAVTKLSSCKRHFPFFFIASSCYFTVLPNFPVDFFFLWLKRGGEEKPTSEGFLLREEMVTSPSCSSKFAGQVLIHVYDEYRKLSRIFFCDRKVILSEMRYFESYQSKTNENDEIEISVNCDVEVFEWLIKYIEQRDLNARPKVLLENIASILVSSEFLQMQLLIDECVSFICSNMQQFIHLCIDFNRLSDSSILQIAQRIHPEDLENINDPNDRMISRIYRKKTDLLLKTLPNLRFCEDCFKVYLEGSHSISFCTTVKRLIGVRGANVSLHQPRREWDIDTYIQGLAQESSIRWSDVFWYLWGLTQTLFCGNCEAYYHSVDLSMCMYHKGQLVADRGQVKYDCCHAPIFHADEIVTSGCNIKRHQLTLTGENIKNNIFEIRDANNVINIFRAKMDYLLQKSSVGRRLSMKCSQLLLFIIMANNSHYLEYHVTSKLADSNFSFRRHQYTGLQVQEEDCHHMQYIVSRLRQKRKKP